MLERRPSLPAGIAVLDDPMQNFGPDAPLGQWARGYSDGQLWLEETWDAHLPEGADDDGDDDPAGLGSLMMVLGFFASREFAESIVREWSKPKPLDQAARKMLGLLPDADARACPRRSDGIGTPLPREADFHSFRRTLITALENLGVDQVATARYVGHTLPTLAFTVYSGESIDGEDEPCDCTAHPVRA